MDNYALVNDIALVWKYADEMFPAFGSISIDWDGAFGAFLPRALAAKDEKEAQLLLCEFLNLLEDGHTDYTPPRAFRDGIGYLPFEPDYAGGKWHIGGANEALSAHIGAEIISINGKSMDDIAASLYPYAYHVGNFIYPSRMSTLLPMFLSKTGNVLKTANGEAEFDLAEAQSAMQPTPAPAASRAFAHTGEGKLKMRLYSGNILYVKWDDCLYDKASDEICAAIAKHSPAGVVLDMRANIGGMTMYGGKVAELFIDGEFHGSQKRTRLTKGIELASASQLVGICSPQTIEKYIEQGLCDREEAEQSRTIWQKQKCEHYLDTYGAPDHKALYHGPLAVLTSRRTISAAEDIVAMFKSNNRAVLIGEPTCGTTGTPLLLRLSMGGMARICSVRYALLDGTEFIGRGIAPHVAVSVPYGPHDAVLGTALEHISR